MSIPSYALPALLALPLAMPSAPPARSAPAPAEQLLKDRDQQKLGEALHDWIQAITENKGVIEAREAVHGELEKWSKKRELGGHEPLSCTEDLGRALWYSNGYNDKSVKKGKISDLEIDRGAAGKVEYALYTPAKYRVADGPYPLLLLIPDKGQRPSDHLNQDWSSNTIRDAALLAAVAMPEQDADWTGDAGTANVMIVLGELTRSYALDFDRIYLCGRGQGVAAAMAIAGRFPDRFAAVLGRAGDAGKVRCDNFGNLPTWFAGAGKEASDFAEASKAAGHDNVTLQPEGKEDDAWAWLQTHPRKGNPETVTLVPGSPFPRKVYWLEVDPQDNPEGKNSVTATIDRAKNTVTVESKGITVVRLYFNDLLVDLSQPVKVVCNGVANEDQIPRSVNDFLDMVRLGRNDPGKLYTASMRYDVPARE